MDDTSDDKIQQPLSGTVITVTTVKASQAEIGFIRPDSLLPAPFTHKDVHFSKKKAHGEVNEGDEVFFVLDKRTMDKPSAYRLWRKDTPPPTEPNKSKDLDNNNNNNSTSIFFTI